MKKSILAALLILALALGLWAGPVFSKDLLKQAKKGDPAAQFSLAETYRKGKASMSIQVYGPRITQKY